ncbi:MAG: galactose mutarotase [Saprospiraceae bacterium]|nr:galactose mutarotase [Saprospiraceae bacterium]
MNYANFESKIDLKPVRLFQIKSNSFSCFITNYGARIVSLQVVDKAMKMTDVVCGFNTLDEYIGASEQYHGATVGRFANRIADGNFIINNTSYYLQKNNGPNSLHGGVKAFHNQVWSCIANDEKSVKLELVSPHMEEGFPGELRVQVLYSIQGSTLQIKYKATTTKDTVVNFTHHSYFNLNGEGTGSILNHLLKINSDYFTPINHNGIPTGNIKMVIDSPFDFTNSKQMGSQIEEDNVQLVYGDGYDHNFVLNQFVEGEINKAAEAIGDQSGIKMEAWTTEPGVQFYTANHFDGTDIGKSGINYDRRSAFCLETQHFPDSPNQKHFPSTLLRANQIFDSVTEYRFSIV